MDFLPVFTRKLMNYSRDNEFCAFLIDYYIYVYTDFCYKAKKTIAQYANYYLLNSFMFARVWAPLNSVFDISKGNLIFEASFYYIYPPSFRVCGRAFPLIFFFIKFPWNVLQLFSLLFFNFHQMNSHSSKLKVEKGEKKQSTYLTAERRCHWNFSN